MSNCSFCGAVEYWHADGEGAVAKPYCHRCHPQQTKVIPLPDDGKHDITEDDLVPGSSSATGPAAPAMTFGNDPNTGIVNNGDPLGFAVGGAHSLEIQDKGNATIVMNGEQVLTTYDEWPEEAEQGTIGFKKGVSGAHVFDGEEWQNLGEALLGKKRNVVKPQDAKCDRRAAIKATKAKNEIS